VEKARKNALIFLLATALALASAISFAGCDSAGVSVGNETATTVEKINYTDTLAVYNASEYMDLTTIADFEREFAIKVEYEEYESNEDLYSEITKNPHAYDVLIPSDYMVDRLIKEGKLAKLDKSKVQNIVNVAEEYLKPDYDTDNEYVVPYMTGSLGILYNKRHTAAPVDSWAALFDSQYNGKVLMLDSMRDTIGLTLKMLGYSMNSNKDDELAQAKSKLQTALYIAAAYNESETIRDKMVAGEGILGVVYSGDAKIAIDRNPDLAYAIPIEGANKWVDGFVILKNSQHMDAAHKFINFMCRPNIAVRNMSNIGYTSPIKGAWSEFGGNKIMFPSSDDLANCEAFLYDADATPKYNRLWSEVR